MKRALVLLSAILAAAFNLPAADNQILGWNNLGMHCMDSDYSVFSILPPYNTIEAQLIVNGALVTVSNGYTITYQAVADPDGSINKTSVGKGNWSQYDLALYGADTAPDTGLLGWKMPGPNNEPQPMFFETMNAPAPGVSTPVNWFRAEGIPITPYDDAGRKNPYPLMRLIAHSGSTPIATNDIVLPVSDEMDCRVCHASGTQAAAQPGAGWVWSDNPERDYRLNILRRHDESRMQQMGATAYATMLTTNGLNAQGLYRTVVADGKPILCAKCHLSEALPGTGLPGVAPLTEAVHSFHAFVMDPDLHITLDNSANRAACYRCHPGSTTKCLRGAMGGAIAQDGSLEMQCQSCHGNMSQVGSSARVGWFMEPNCQSCHTGTAVSNNGQIRYTSSFTDANGTVRTPVSQTFATSPNIPATGLSLYRFSTGHGGLQCSACHGSTHAEFPATHQNDNLRNIAIQGHAGVMSECTACHTTTPSTTSGGPHGMHPVGSTWVSRHPDIVENSGSSQCRACHGTDYRGTVLSLMQANRTLNAFGTKNWWRGFQVGCYNCHNGPSSEDGNNNSPAVVSNVTTNTSNNTSLAFHLPGADANGNPLTFRVVSQPAHGTVGLSNNIATYFPEPGFVGTETFTFAAWDGSTDSNLGTGTVTVEQGPISIVAKALVPPSYPADWAVPFGIHATPANASATPTYEWSFGDGTHSTSQYATHTYAAPGNYQWSVVARVQSGASAASVTNSGSIAIEAPAMLSSTVSSGGGIEFSWPAGSADALLEETSDLGSGNWNVTTNNVSYTAGGAQVNISTTTGAKFYRLRKL